MADSRWMRLRSAAGVAALLILAAQAGGALYGQDRADTAAFHAVMKLAETEHLQSLPIGEVMARVGRQFLGTPYVAHTLESPGEERLVLNLREFDCTTFMENVLVLSRCIMTGKTTFARYREELQFVRYRGGFIDGYPSRLHYFTDWVFDNERRGILRNISGELGGVISRKTINIMSTHPESYRQLADTSFLRRVAAGEAEMSARGFAYVPRERVAEVLPRLKEGDVIATVTETAGVDVSHTGLLVQEGGTLHFMHAPLSGKKVLISDGTLAQYVAAIRSVSGIVVARPMSPHQ